MTAKEQLLEIVEGWSEAEAEKWLCVLEPNRLRASQVNLTATELLRLPKAARSAAIRAQLALLTPEEIQEDLEQWEEWEAGTGADVTVNDA